MIGLQLNTSQQLSASPRLQHAVRLLQMSSLDFTALVHASLSSNPFLESDDAIEPETAEGDREGTPEANDDPRELPESEEAYSQPAADDHEYWQHGQVASSASADAPFTALDSTAVRVTLGQHLMGQLKVLHLTPRELALAGAIVESLDDDGYLRVSLDKLLDPDALDPFPDTDELRIALRRVQALDPAGVGARSVGECLRLQIDSIDCNELRTLATQIVDQHLPALAARDSAGIAKVLGAPAENVAAACDAIRRLDPRPGWRFDTAPADYVVPDIIVRKIRGEWRASLNPAVMPRVRMNQLYAGLFRQHRTQHHGELANQLQEARWTVRNVEQRFATILAIAEAIVRRQRHFLDFGAMAMKPLGLREIADEVGVHESTVSRATNNKFMATPNGVFELKHFFSRALVSTNGRACSGTAIRGLVEEMIHAERAGEPLSDAAITRQLAEQGLVLARRTVTKYRQMLRIEPVEKRRRMA